MGFNQSASIDLPTRDGARQAKRFEAASELRARQIWLVKLPRIEGKENLFFLLLLFPHVLVVVVQS